VQVNFVKVNRFRCGCKVSYPTPVVVHPRSLFILLLSNVDKRFC